MLANVFINSQFNYTSLVWMFAGKISVTKICKIHYRMLQIIHNNYQKSYDELLDINKDVNIHPKHLRILVLEVFKSLCTLIQNSCGVISMKIQFLVIWEMEVDYYYHLLNL